MACAKCGSGGCGSGGSCSTSGCNKLNSHDWLNNMLPPDATEIDNIYEIQFKNTRKSFYRNVNGLRINIGDWVVVEGDRGGFDIGQVMLGGVLANLQFQRKNGRENDILKLYRKASEGDMMLLSDVRDRERETTVRTREIVKDLKLDMKLSDVEFQGDGTKATFYYIADHRVDFRELIKLLAKEFRIRVEMKQIGLRHEAALVGGLGVCGRELCCSTWLTSFKVVNTAAARYQNLSLNPAKISGLCGRLKCCLNFELDAYRDALKHFPDVEELMTEKGKVVLQKTDIFRNKMWFSYPDETTWYPLDIEVVKEIMKKNKRHEPVPPLSNSKPEEDGDEKQNFDFVDVVGQQIDSSSRERQKERDGKRDKRRDKDRGSDNRPRGKEQVGQKQQNATPKGENRNAPPKQQPPRNDRNVPPQNQPPKQQPPKNERNVPPQNQPPKQQAPRNERNVPPQNQPPKQQPPRNERNVPPQNQPPKQQPPRSERNVPPQNQPPKQQPPRNERNVPPQNQPPKQQPPRGGHKNPPPPRNKPINPNKEE
ncbi:MAG: stage 0 sporulation family protein [Bacteroidia bacterium]